MNVSPRLALMLTVPPLLWAGNAVVGRLMVGYVPPLALNAMRWLLALVLLAPLGWRVFGTAENRRRIAERWPYLALLALAGVGTYNALQYMALHTSTPLNVTLIAASSPLWMMLIGALAYGARPQGRQLGAAALSLLGVLVVLTRGDVGAVRELHFLRGDLLMLAATAAWAMYSWMLARPPASMQGEARPPWNWAELLMIQIAFGSLWGVAAAGAEHAVAPQDWQFTPWLPLVLLYVAVGPSLICYRLWALGVAQAGPPVAALFSNLTPLFAALLQALLIGEWPQPFHAAAFALIVAGIVLSSRR
jgi:drug/metabolite transporter (DMT)-like permease